MSAPSLGQHILLDCHGIDPALARDANRLEIFLRNAAREAGATVLQSYFHRFGGSAGVTGMLLLCESHISIHTWPEHSFAAIDIFMCGASAPLRAADYLQQALSPARTERSINDRGILFAPA